MERKRNGAIEEHEIKAHAGEWPYVGKYIRTTYHYACYYEGFQ